LMQVFYQTGDPAIEQRETKGLLEASEELHVDKLTVLTWDEEKRVERNKKIINFVPLWKWLLNQDIYK